MLKLIFALVLLVIFQLSISNLVFTSASLEIKSYRDESINSIFFPCAADVNSKTNQVYVTSRSSQVWVVDGPSKTIIQNFTVGKNPCELAINEDLNLVYISNEFSNTIDVIDGDTSQKITSFDLENPYDVAINPNTNILYITSDIDGISLCRRW